ncbi:MAG: hypothetical protein RSE14_05695 [Erythrobacter sp.]|uniref:hypothetical protein n=1 Tax=Erythrobacter sp. TaxID=1042 RepID=UPI002B4A33D6|nr:hypothetical protein [Erythrobacter sp.]WRH71584.1 MAG: hypothetical protein RSE14_05695 [Erythrobacter sp.]
MFRIFVAFAFCIAAPANAEFYPAPSSVKMVSEQKVSSCEFLGLAYEADSFVSKSMDKAARKALDEALTKASQGGANTVIFKGISSANKELIVTLMAYRC